MYTSKINKDLHNLKELFDCSYLNQDHGIFSNENEKAVGKYKIELPKYICLDDFLRLRSKANSFKCRSDNKNTER